MGTMVMFSKPKKVDVPKVVGQGQGLDHEDILNANAKGAVLIVSGFVSDSHEGTQGSVIATRTEADAMGPFMDIQKVTDAMTRPVSIVQAYLPEGKTSNGIKLVSRGPRGKDGTLQVEVAQEDSGEGFPFPVRWLTKVHRPRHIRRPIPVLSTRVEEEDLVGGDAGTCLRFGLVMNDGSIGTSRGNRIKAQIHKILLFCTKGMKFVCCLILGDAVVLFVERVHPRAIQKNCTRQRHP